MTGVILLVIACYLAGVGLLTSAAYLIWGIPGALIFAGLSFIAAGHRLRKGMT